MAVGSVEIVQINNGQGAFKEPEGTHLFIGRADGAQEGIHTISAATDLDALLGTEYSGLKTQLAAAILNAKSDNYFAYAIALKEGADWVGAVLAALEKPHDLNVEAVVYCDPIETNTEIVNAQTLTLKVRSTYAKLITCFLCITGIDAGSETWAQYITRAKSIIGDGVQERVAMVPLLHGNNLGAIAGRLCNPAASIADTPMRVATGVVEALGEAPTDVLGYPLTMDHIKELSINRMSVPQWYPGVPGTYWADHPMLDKEGGDFQAYEWLRVLDYLARRVRILAIQRIGDRRLNSTPASISHNKTYFGRPLREAAQTMMIQGVEQPGLIKPPKSDAIEITWTSNTKVSISISATPFECPKEITVYLGLDLDDYK